MPGPMGFKLLKGIAPLKSAVSSAVATPPDRSMAATEPLVDPDMARIRR